MGDKLPLRFPGRDGGGETQQEALDVGGTGLFRYQLECLGVLEAHALGQQVDVLEKDGCLETLAAGVFQDLIPGQAPMDNTDI